MVIHGEIQRMNGFIRFTFLLRDAVGAGDGDALGERRLGLHRRIHMAAVEVGQVFFINVSQGLLDVHVAIEIDVAVGRMVETAMEFGEFTEREHGNHFRIAAGLYAIGGIREKFLCRPVFENGFRCRESAFHFIVYHAIVGQRCVLVFQLIVPAFLHENLRILQAVRIENSVQIHVHQIVEIHRIAAGDGVHGLVRPGDGIQECIQRALRQFHERFLQRIFPRTAQSGMLHDVGRALGIIRGGAETNIKHLIVIVAVQVKQTSAALHVLHQIGIGIDFFDIGHAIDTETVHHVSIIPFHKNLLRGSESSPLPSMAAGNFSPPAGGHCGPQEKAQAKTCAFSTVKYYSARSSARSSGKNSS